MSAPADVGALASTLNVWSVFSGIGGLELGLERAGMSVVGQVELNPFCRQVLAKHWPEVPRHDDVRTAPAWWSAQPRPAVDVVAGGFPCQPFSTAGRRRGIADERWGWPWMADVIRLVRPRYVLVENVAALLADTEAFGWILADLATLGFDASWGVFTACSVGAPHVRRRLFLVAHPHSVDGFEGLGFDQQEEALRGGDVPAGPWADRVDGLVEAARRSPRMADGIPTRLDRPASRVEADRVRALGNAVVPAVAQHIGQLITAHAQGR